MISMLNLSKEGSMPFLGVLDVGKPRFYRCWADWIALRMGKFFIMEKVWMKLVMKHTGMTISVLCFRTII